eukprot:TRINITY_DN12499_c0_g1_i1.p1 TRINITY_DN12499_c0_g1~~TRINITY_DN12499_c0_g1_i1.p1  ORF type:complete len:206 (+),score=29.94 TRINITY_DN12499_c0_g1_i1:68-685(+)
MTQFTTFASVSDYLSHQRPSLHEAIHLVRNVPPEYLHQYYSTSEGLKSNGHAPEWRQHFINALLDTYKDKVKESNPMDSQSSSPSSTALSSTPSCSSQPVHLAMSSADDNMCSVFFKSTIHPLLPLLLYDEIQALALTLLDVVHHGSSTRLNADLFFQTIHVDHMATLFKSTIIQNIDRILASLFVRHMLPCVCSLMLAHICILF